MQIEVGKSYKCGVFEVKIIHYNSELKKKSWYPYIGMCFIPHGGGVLLARFDEDGDWAKGNPSGLDYELQELISPETQQKLERIAKIEQELKQLKEEIENETK